MKHLKLVNNNDILGKGAFAVVYKCVHYGKDVAVKRIELLRLDQSVEKREEETMRKLDHPNVLQLIYVSEDKNFKYLVLELCTSTLQDYILREELEDTSWMPSAANALNQMAGGLKHIHDVGLVHRDITAKNVLVQRCDNHQLTLLKISDFGFCKPAGESGSFSISKDGKGTTYFIAPELLDMFDKSEKKSSETNGELMAQRRATNACDIFSLGCLFYCFFTKGVHPFAKGDNLAINQNIRDGKYSLEKLNTPETSFAKNIIEKMIQNNPNQRLKIDDVILELEPFLITT